MFGVTLIFVAGGVARTKFITYVSDALDHGGLIASRFMERVLQHVPRDTKTLNLWSDCGPRFRCYQFAHWALIELPRKLKVDRGVEVGVRLQFFCEMHGKGPCDGHFSVLKSWIQAYCVKGGTVAALSDVKVAFDEGAAVSMELHSPPAGPEHINEIVDIAALGVKPASVAEIACYGPNPTLPRISKTYCLVSRLIPIASVRQKPELVYDVRVDNHVFADREQSERVGTSSGWIRTRTLRIPPAERAWRIGRRDKEPEKETFSAEKLQRRMEAQLHAAVLPTASARRASFFTRCQRARASAEKARAKRISVGAAVSKLSAAAKAKAKAQP